MTVRRLPGWAPLAALAASLVLAWLNFLLTGHWAALPGALNGSRQPWYAAALLVATILTIATRSKVGRSIRVGWAASAALLVAGAGLLTGALLSRLPPATWGQIPFSDDWTELYQQAVNGVHLLYRGSVVGWNWWLMGGYPTSTDIAQNLSTLAIVPMALAGEQVGYHLLHAAMFLSLPVLVWWDISREDRESGVVAGGFACVFVAGYFVTLGNSGDTNSLAGVLSASVALTGSRAARLGLRWGGPLLLLGLTLGLYTHQAFFVYAVILLALESVYFRDRAAAIRLVVASAVAGVAALPMHWESLRYPAYVSFNNVKYDPGSPTDWGLFFRTVFYNVEILAHPHRWFNDYRSLANVWLPALVVAALQPSRSRVGYFAWAAVLVQALLRLNTPEVGAMFDRLQHMLPVLAAPALAGFVLRFGGTRRLAVALTAVIGLYVGTSFVPVPHVPELRAWDPPLIDRVAGADGSMILFEVNPHRDMDSDPVGRTPKTPFNTHFEGLLPSVAGQRFYSQMIDGWVWNVWRGQVVGGGTFRGRAIAETPIDDFVAEMRRWGVRHLFVWTDASRRYLADSGGRFVEKWRSDRWSQFEVSDADLRSVVVPGGSGSLRNLDFLGGDVALSGATGGDLVVVRTNYYPAWRAFVDGQEVPLFSSAGQLAFRAPRSGAYAVRLEYPRYRWLSIVALLALAAGAAILRSWPAHLPGRSA